MNSCQGPSHFNQQFAGQITEWSGADNEINLKKNCSNPETKQKLSDHGWLESKIFYRYNSEGFRDDNFDQQTCYIALGCSHTEGVGISESDTWPKQLENLLGVKVWNLGVGGSALDTCFRLLDYWIHYLNPVGVICAVPPKWRFEVFEGGNWSNILHTSTYQRFDGYVKTYFSFDENSDTNRKKNIMAMQNICDVKGTPFYPNMLNKFGNGSLARDLMHHGASANANLSQQFYNQITGKNYDTDRICHC